MAERVIVLPSPLLGPAAYRPLASHLGTLGWEAVVAELPPPPFSPGQVRDAFVSAALVHRASVVLAHSNAGHYAAAVAETAGAATVVYVDAALPPEDGPSPLAPPALLDGIRHHAGPDGLLEPWTRWWPPEDVRALVPSPEWLERIEAEQPRVTLAYLCSTVPVPAGWWRRPSGYLAFGTTYAAQLAAARGLTWPVATLDGHHLHLLGDPAGVAATVVDLHARVMSGR